MSASSDVEQPIKRPFLSLSLAAVFLLPSSCGGDEQAPRQPREREPPAVRKSAAKMLLLLLVLVLLLPPPLKKSKRVKTSTQNNLLRVLFRSSFSFQLFSPLLPPFRSRWAEEEADEEAVAEAAEVSPRSAGAAEAAEASTRSGRAALPMQEAGASPTFFFFNSHQFVSLFSSCSLYLALTISSSHLKNNALTLPHIRQGPWPRARRSRRRRRPRRRERPQQRQLFRKPRRGRASGSEFSSSFF